MKRPDFVTYEDIQRWSAEVDSDPHLSPGLKENVIFRELGYAGLWLSEELEKLGCEDDISVRIQYTAAQASFGRDIWAVHQQFLDAFKNNELEFEDDPAPHNLQ
jgi:hypothetical protein